MESLSHGGITSQRTWLGWLLVACLAGMACAQQPELQPLQPIQEAKPKIRPPLPKLLPVFKTDVTLVTTPAGPLWSADLTPADFLDNVGEQLKARWRQLYRPPSPAPSSERERAAFTLGTLLADGYLALKATDAQQFRNVSQDMMNYCRVLALGEKLAPRLMSEANLAQDEKWAELRQELINGHQELCRFLREQKDDDLACLVDLGVWLRMVQIVSQLVVEAKDPLQWKACVGSPELIADIYKRYTSLGEVCRNCDQLRKLGEVVAYLEKTWSDKTLVPDAATAERSHERVTVLIRSLSQKQTQ
jgi:hypothetical protein